MIRHTFAFRSWTSRGDPRAFRRAELAHSQSNAVRPSGILSGTVVPTVLFGQFQLSFPAQRSGYLPLRSWSRNGKVSLFGIGAYRCGERGADENRDASGSS